MQFTVTFSDEAIETFDAIGLQLQAKWGEREINKFRKRAYEVVDIITKFPMIFQEVSKTQSVRKAFIHKNCSMFYKIGDRNIKVLFFWDNRQDPIFR